MPENIFIPRVNSRTDIEDTTSSSSEHSDSTSIRTVERSLLATVRYVVIFLMVLLPIFFIPGALVSVGFDKSMLAAAVGAVGAVALIMASLQVRQMRTVLPISLGLFWLFVITNFVAAVLSGDAHDSLRGGLFEPTTAGFLFLLGLVLTLPLALQRSKGATIKALATFGISAVLLLIYGLLRVFLGADFLSFNQFFHVSLTPLGTLNDLAIFAVATIVIGIIALLQLPVRSVVQYLIVATVLLALVMVSIVNFSIVWYPLGFFAILIFLYLISKQVLFGVSQSEAPMASRVPLVLSLIIMLVSALFIFAGEPISAWTSDVLQISYVEVRPSFIATTDIARAVFHEDPILGIGPNRFVDAWRLYKDPLINETAYWDTEFQAGYGLVPTVFVTSGIVGGVLLILFHLSFLYLGFRMFVRSTRYDAYWSFFGLASFAAACLLWGMSYFYVLSSGLLLLGALFTGLTYAAAGSLLPNMVRTIPLASSRQRGFVLMAAAIIILTMSVAGVLSLGKQYVASSIFARAMYQATTPEEFVASAQQAYSFYPDDRFSIAQVERHIISLKSLINIAEPTEEDVRSFNATTDLAVITATAALAFDRTNPINHAVLASVYNTLSLAGVGGAVAKAEQSLNNAIALDPQNPVYHVVLARLALQQNDFEKAHTHIQAALDLKRNYSDALFFLAQLDIQEGNTEAAIATTRDIIILEPQNPTRYFQLGVLLAAVSDNAGARQSFTKAIALDPYYANARYLLALEYLKGGERDLAREQLIKVQETNPDNADLVDLLQSIESGEAMVGPMIDMESAVPNASSSEVSAEATSGQIGTDSRLISPANPVVNGALPNSNQEVSPTVVEQADKSVLSGSTSSDSVRE